MSPLLRNPCLLILALNASAAAAPILTLSPTPHPEPNSLLQPSATALSHAPARPTSRNAELTTIINEFISRAKQLPKPPLIIPTNGTDIDPGIILHVNPARYR